MRFPIGPGGKPVVERGYDFDGVLTKGVQPTVPFVIITGRTLERWDKDLERWAEKAPIYVRPYGARLDNESAMQWKAQVVEWLGIKEFHEDDRTHANYIADKNPDCRVVLYATKEET